MRMSRRRFLAASLATTIAPAISSIAENAGWTDTHGVNLVPAEASKAPNYWCTWATQNYMYGHDLPHLDPTLLEGDTGAELARAAMTEENVFAKTGWAKSFYPRVREDLFFLLDDGWETGGSATFEVDAAKFPSFSGDPSERLRKLSHAVRNEGWRGAALWCRNTPDDDRAHHLETLSTSAEVEYWKIDLGDPNFDLVRLRNETHLPLTLEHVHGELPVNGDWKDTGRFGAQAWDSNRMTILRNTDVYRTYDVTAILSLPTTLDRLAAMLRGAEGHPEIKALLNLEDEVYLAAVMGCTMGIMRHPLVGMRPEADPDLFFNGSRQTKKRLDEVARALRWQRIAAPFSPGSGRTTIDEEVLHDSWTFASTETWQKELVGQTVHQGAPARIARNIDLPEVKTKGEKPFVFAARFPNGAVAIGSQERTKVGKAWYMPACDVTLAVADAQGPYGIFGHFDNLTLQFNTIPKQKRVLAQDLAADKSVDVTNAVNIRGNTLHIPGRIIRDIGLRAATPGDLSSPALVIVFA